VRDILDNGGLSDTAIFASGGIDEDSIAALLQSGAPIDGFGIGTSLTTSSDVPALDCAYKLQEYAGTPRRKHSAGKATWPGRKQVWRSYRDGRMAGDILSLDSDGQPGEPLIEPVMRNGRRLKPSPSLDGVRGHAARQLAQLPEELRQLKPGASYQARIGQSLSDLASAFDRRLAEHERVSHA